MNKVLKDEIITEEDTQGDIRFLVSRINQYVIQENLPVYVALSKIENAGWGLFARRNIQEDQVVTAYGGRFLTAEQAKKTLNNIYFFDYPKLLVELDPKNAKLSEFKKFWEGSVLDGRFGFPLSKMGRWANSIITEEEIEKQNVVSVFDGEDNGVWKLNLVAVRDIKQGEEIIWNYGPSYYWKNLVKPVELCISCNLNDSVWVERNDSSKKFCSHMCQKHFYLQTC